MGTQEFALNEQKTVETILKKHATLLEKIKNKKERYWQLHQSIKEEEKKNVRKKTPPSSNNKNVLMAAGETSPLKPPISFSTLSEGPPKPMQLSQPHTQQQQPRTMRPVNFSSQQLASQYLQMQQYQQMMLRNPNYRQQWSNHMARMQGHFDPSQHQRP